MMPFILFTVTCLVQGFPSPLFRPPSVAALDTFHPGDILMISHDSPLTDCQGRSNLAARLKQEVAHHASKKQQL